MCQNRIRHWHDFYQQLVLAFLVCQCLYRNAKRQAMISCLTSKTCRIFPVAKVLRVFYCLQELKGEGTLVLKQFAIQCKTLHFLCSLSSLYSRLNTWMKELRDNTSRKGGLPTLPGLYRSTIQPSRRGFYRIHVCEEEDNWRQYIQMPECLSSSVQ